MQDRYAGDIGDFGKYGLLRWMCREDAQGPRLRLGVLWYRYEDKTPGDGKHVDYLDPPHDPHLRDCDPDLFRKMQLVVGGQRSIKTVQEIGALPDDTLCFPNMLMFSRSENRPERHEKRRRWTAAGLKAVSEAEIVFADPDNGLEVRSVSRFSLKGPKYAYYDDLRACTTRGQSLVIYQHISRRGSADSQLKGRLEELRAEGFGGARDAVVLRYRRGTSRAYIVLPA